MQRKPRIFRCSDEEIIKIYQETGNLRKTSKIVLDVFDSKLIKNKLESLGVTLKKSKKQLISDDELIKLYQSGKTLLELAKIAYNSVGGMTVRNKLQQLGFDTSYQANLYKYRERLSRAFKKYKLNEHVFDTIDTEEKAYWLGFLMSDGYNHEDRKAVSLRLQDTDLEILEKLRLFLETDAPIKFYDRQKYNKNNKNVCDMTVNSVHLSQQLASLGCVQKKTYVLEFPTCVPNYLLNHFIRGYFDGDGCISVRPRLNRRRSYGTCMVVQFTICGRKEFLEVLQNKIVENTKIHKNTLKSVSNNFAQRIHYSGRNVVKRIMDYLYKDATVYMKRKHDKYLEL